MIFYGRFQRKAAGVAELGAPPGEQIKFEIRDNINTAADMIDQLEWMKKKITDLRDVMARKDLKDMAAAVVEFGKKFQSVEDELFQPTIAESDTKSFRDPQKVYEKLSVLAGDISGSVDFAPNKQQREVYAVLKESLATQKGRFEGLIKTDLASFNKLLADRGVAGIIVPVVK